MPRKPIVNPKSVVMQQAKPVDAPTVFKSREEKIKYGSEVLIQEWRPLWRGDLIGLGGHIRDLIIEVTQKPKPSYTLKRDSYQWNEYLDTLMKCYGMIQGELSELDTFEYKKPYWYRSQHRSHYNRWN